MSQTPSSSTTTSSTTTSSTSSSSSSTSQNTCQVSNNIALPTSPSTGAQTNWNGDIIVISGYDGSGNATDFQQSDLTLLSFTEEGSSASALTATTSSNSGTLPINTVGTLNLLPYYEPGSTTNVMSAYSLLVCQDNNYFPVYTLPEKKSHGSFPAITVPGPSPCNSSSAANAYVFLQNLMAFPSSPLAQQFTSALNNATSANSSESVSAAINTFFGNTAGYTNVNFDVFSAVMSYGQTFPYIWANFESTYTYNFYSTTPDSSATSSTGSTNVTVDEQVTSLGTVVFTLTNSAPSTPAEAMEAYTITWKPAGKNQTTVPLTLNDGQLVSINSAGFGGICLQCTFTDMAALTGNSADSGIPIQALTGLINNTKVLGSPVTLNESIAAKIGGGINRVFASKYFEALQIAICLYMGIELMTKLCGWIKAKCIQDNNTPPDQDEIDSTETKMQDDANEKLEKTGNDGEVKTGDELSNAQVQAESTELNTKAETEEEGEIVEQSSEEDEQLDLEDNDTIDNEVNATNEAQDQLEDVNPESADASEEIGNIQGELTANQDAIANENQAEKISSESTVEQQETTDTDLEDDEETDEKDEADDEDGDFADDVGDVADL